MVKGGSVCCICPKLPPTAQGIVRREQWYLVRMEEGRGMKQTQFLPFQPSEVVKLKEVWVFNRQNEIPEVKKPWFT